jgi:hypothetical protein
MTLLAALIALPLVACGGGDSTTVEVTGATGTESEPGVFLDGTSSDERLVGRTELTIECDITEDGDTTVADCSGPNIITNDGGTWDGTCEGTSTWTTAEPEHVHDFDCTYLGSGDYDGLRFVQHLEGIDYPWSYTGHIEPVD